MKINKQTINYIFEKKRKLIIKVFLATLLINICIYGFAKQVGKQDIIIKYAIVNDSILSQKRAKTNSIGKEKYEIDNNFDSEKTIDTIVDNSTQQTHSVGDDLRYTNELYEKICQKNYQICNVTIFNGSFSHKEKIVYQSIILYLIRNIDKSLYTQNKLRDNVYSIKINKDNNGRRGYAGHHSISINLSSIKSNKEFKEVFTHELGHIIDLGLINGLSNYKDYNYTEFGEETFSQDDLSLDFYGLSWLNENNKKDISSFRDFVSGYGLSDPFEDFAECVNLFINHHSLFEQMAQSNYIISQKYQFMKHIFNGIYLFEDKSHLGKLQTDPDRRPWDTTKIK